MNFEKSEGGLIPAVIQDAESHRVLMIGYMNRESYEKTLETKKVTFFSRSRQSIWVKGETSGNFLDVVEISPDCDGDALLIKASPVGPTCHRGTTACFDSELGFLTELEAVIESRKSASPETSYVAKLFARGLDRIAQKVGEEAVETVIAAKNSDAAVFESEASDLLFHLMVLLKAKGSSLGSLVRLLKTRHQDRS